MLRTDQHELNRLLALRLSLMNDLIEQQAAISKAAIEIERNERMNEIRLLRTPELKNINDAAAAIDYLANKKIPAVTARIENNRKYFSRMKWAVGIIGGLVALACAVGFGFPILMPAATAATIGAVIGLSGTALIKGSIMTIFSGVLISPLATLLGWDKFDTNQRTINNALHAKRERLTKLKEDLSSTVAKLQTLQQDKQQAMGDKRTTERRLSETSIAIAAIERHVNAQPSLAGSMHGLHAPRRSVEPIEQQEAIVRSRRNSASL